jgi:hypothetical protein
MKRWKHVIGWGASIAMAALWLVAGIWKLTNISDFQLTMTQLLVPVAWSLPATFALAVVETFTGLLLLRSTWRRWGGHISMTLLIVFMIYVGINYEALRGADCSCFPWIERAVGPGFFVGDGIMLMVSALATFLAPRSTHFRSSLVLLGGIAILGGFSMIWDQSISDRKYDIPEKIQVDSGELNLHHGQVFIYFFNPTCLHCLDAGITMSEFTWRAIFVGVPTQDFDFASGFVDDTSLKDVRLSPELDLLRTRFPFEDVPYGVAIKNGQVVEKVRFFEKPELEERLRQVEFIE